MSVMAFKEVQPMTRDLIAGHSFFLSREMMVIENRGKPQQEIEDALKEDGWCAVVYPLQSSKEVHSGQGAATTKGTIEVAFLFNANFVVDQAASASDPFDIYDMVNNGISAVLNYQNNTQSHDRFFLESWEIYEYDEGTWGYMVTFSKACEFRRSE